jgi:hypothetical protein
MGGNRSFVYRLWLNRCHTFPVSYYLPLHTLCTQASRASSTGS